MKTVETVLHHMTDAKSIMQDLKDTLKVIDPEFQSVDVKYLEAATTLEEQVGQSISPSVNEFLAAMEDEFASAIIYIGWQGFQLNLDIFNNPVNALLLKEDYEDLHRERRLHTIPVRNNARQTINAFYDELKKLPGGKLALTDDITSYYTYLETTGYKIAHFFGFRLADVFLPHVIPGYTDDAVNTISYRMALRNYLKLDLDLIEQEKICRQNT